MRKKSFSIVAFTLICSIPIMAQDQVKIPNGISMAFKAGDAADLSILPLS
jgi:hypothetical protein